MLEWLWDWCSNCCKRCRSTDDKSEDEGDAAADNKDAGEDDGNAADNKDGGDGGEAATASREKYVASQQLEVKELPVGDIKVVSDAKVVAVDDKNKDIDKTNVKLAAPVPSDGKKAFHDLPADPFHTPTLSPENVIKKHEQERERGPQTLFDRQRVQNRLDSQSRLSTVNSLPSGLSNRSLLSNLSSHSLLSGSAEQREQNIVESSPNSPHSTPRGNATSTPKNLPGFAPSASPSLTDGNSQQPTANDAKNVVAPNKKTPELS